VNPATAILACIAVPVVGALLVTLTGRWPNVRESVTLLSAATLFALVLFLFRGVAAGARPEALVAEMMPGLSIAFAVEPLGMLFALVASFLWIVTSIYSIGYMRGHHEINQTRFYACFALALGSTMGVAFAGNLLTLFVFYEALTLSTYPLVIHSGTDEARRAGRLYLGMLLGTSIAFQLVAIIWTGWLAGTLTFTPGGILSGKASGATVAILLVLYVFGIAKAAVMPFHRWLPAAMVAPTPVSALLHAVAVVKAGVFAVLKITVYVFGLDAVREAASSEWLQYAAAATIVIASLVALTKDNLKARLAYSTVSQLSYIVLGAMLATTWGVVGGAIHLAAHAFGKITLFYCAGAIAVASHKTEVSQLRGIGRVMPLTTFAFFVGSLSVIGLPPLGGLWGKWFLALGALEADQAIMVAVLMASSLLNVAYLMPIPIRGFFARADGSAEGDKDPDRPPIAEAPIPCLVAISVSTLGCVALFFYAGPMFDLLRGAVVP
jgi:multicomponent Na+:H+ antiporter subunit D